MSTRRLPLLQKGLVLSLLSSLILFTTSLGCCIVTIDTLEVAIAEGAESLSRSRGILRHDEGRSRASVHSTRWCPHQKHAVEAHSERSLNELRLCGFSPPPPHQPRPSHTILFYSLSHLDMTSIQPFSFLPPLLSISSVPFVHFTDTAPQLWFPFPPSLLSSVWQHIPTLNPVPTITSFFGFVTYPAPFSQTFS